MSAPAGEFGVILTSVRTFHLVGHCQVMTSSLQRCIPHLGLSLDIQ